MTHAYLLGSAGFVADAGIPLTDRGFRYGMSVFETVAIREGRPLLMEAHLAAVAESSALAQFHPRAHWNEATRSQLLAPPITEGVARIYVTAGDHDGAESRVALLFEAMSIPTELSVTRAVTVPFTPATPFGKTGNYWQHLLARPTTGGEAILVASNGMLLGGATSNLFLVRDGALLTPATPVRQGVVRAWIGGTEAPLTRADLATADTAFLTNSRFGLCEITHIDGRELDGADPIDQLWQRYRMEVLRVG
jgi:branched-subunit amino acid aminotransferase/4-amino-4-deoxychorismate lyase